MSDTAWTATRSPHADPAALARKLRRLRRVATLMDAAVAVPGTRIRFGWDAVLGLVPGGGDTIGLLIGGWIVAEAARLGVPASVLVRMLLNIAIDAALGTVPLAGDLFDVLWRANLRNVDLLERHLGVTPPP